ncbi:MAG: lysophospholipid acyltransferase family protein [Prolixibacteraceae bacterium]|jgi:putative hemolysin
MKLVHPRDLVKASPIIQYLGGEYFARILMHLLSFHKINDLYENVSQKTGIDSIDAIIKYLNITLDFDENDLKKLPADGSFITVSNHPFGGIDGILLIKLLSLARGDHKVIANFLLKKVEPISDYFLAVNPFENMPEAGSSVPGIKTAIDHLNKGGVLSFFPAGEVSTNYSSSVVSDREWLISALRFIKKSKVPVVPIYFHGTNSRLFHLLGRIHPILRTAKLPSELINKRNKTIKVRIGNPISVKEQSKFSDIHQFGRYLRSKTYCLDSGIEVKRFFNYSLKREQIIQKIAEAQPVGLITKEIDLIRKDYKLFGVKNYEVFCAPTCQIPEILNELGRLREITFREVGEGTNRASDIDEFDLYYNQLIIWDSEKQKIAGGYRIGKGAEIMERYGVRGFYTHSLFRMRKGFRNTLQQSLELGRSFVVPEYQKKPLPLFLLWKGILYFLLKNPEYRYLIGPVSISNTYSNISKELIIRHIMAHYYDFDKAAMVRPRNRYKVKTNDGRLNIAMEQLSSELSSLDKFIGDVDQYNRGLPVLLKKYLSLNAKIIAFNVDPKFNNCVDGMIVLDIYDIPVQTIEGLSKEFSDLSLLIRFYSNRE